MENTLNSFCKHLASLDRFFVLDTETTGLHDGEICQIAIIDNEGKTVFCSMIKTFNPIPSDATVIHGINDEMVKDSPTYPQIAPRIQTLLKGQTVVVFNAVYDRKMLHKTAECYAMEHYDWKQQGTWLCAMEAYAEFFGDWNDYHKSYRWQPLTRAARNCGVKVDKAHDALGDCIMTLGVTNHLLKWYKESQSE